MAPGLPVRRGRGWAVVCEPWGEAPRTRPPRNSEERGSAVGAAKQTGRQGERGAVPGGAGAGSCAHEFHRGPLWTLAYAVAREA